MVASCLVSLLDLGKSVGFVYEKFIGVGEGSWLRIWYFFEDGEEWWLRVWCLYWNWGRVVASYIVSLLELGNSGGFMYGTTIGVGEGWWLCIWYFLGDGEEWWLRK